MSVIEINWTPKAAQLRSFGYTALGGFGLSGLIVAWRTGAFGATASHAAWTAPSVLWAVGVVVFLVGLARPTALRPVYVGLMAATFPIGWVVSHVLLGLTYFVLFALVGLLLRITGRDPLERRFNRGLASYWTPRATGVDVQRYFRQF
jgi:hypothetical protein